MTLQSKYYKRISRQYGKQLRASSQKGSPNAQVMVDKMDHHAKLDKKAEKKQQRRSR